MRTLSLSLLAAGSLTAFPFALTTVAQEEDGATIQVGPDSGVDVRVDGAGREAEPRRRRFERRLRDPGFAERAPVAVSRYWIGLGGAPLPPELRAQIDVEANEGLLVRTVAEEGPAAEAGVEKFDILLRANGKPLSTIEQLSEVVGEQGELKGRITLDLLRRGKRTTLWVTPAERPAGAIAPAPAQPRRRFGERLGGRLFGPGGMIEEGGLEELLGGGFGGEGLGGLAEMVPQMAGAGVSVGVQRNGDGPAKVTVKRGDQIWEFDEGDEAALAALPADIRPMVERMLQGAVQGQEFNAFGFGGPGFQMQFGGDMAKQVEQMQRRMLGRMQGRLGGPDPNAAPPRFDLDEAPAFNAEDVPEIQPEAQEDAGPVEIEIPAGT